MSLPEASSISDCSLSISNPASPSSTLRTALTLSAYPSSPPISMNPKGALSVLSLIPKWRRSSLTTSLAAPASGNGPHILESLGGFLVYMIRGLSCAVMAMNGNDFWSFSIELYLGWWDLISSLSRTRASDGL